MRPKYVALLRSVNLPGAATRLSMADLRGLFEGLGFRDARTLLNSGNVIFSGPGSGGGDMAGRIEKTLEARLDLTTTVIVLSRNEVVTVVEDNPFAAVAHNPSWLLVVVPRRTSELDRLKPVMVSQPHGHGDRRAA